ncbi:lytic transglycosylase domain-containing protein [Mesorhizobium australicum]|uniref:Transglycosylase SLT domain-containing protein n=1 Tax=Mesorhizobium australicum TaxID=536018 RepID=A0A1X7MXT9_9HYPH|nr:lytic transglycosylase domain-containing protein [Mesorhizobium australicum]SMH29687.1 Transglycosylase SLT domain-containing protein [Mesorhizobium australicum]
MRPFSLMSVVRRHGRYGRVVLLLLSGLSILAPALCVQAQDGPVSEQTIDARFDPFVAEASARFRIPVEWIRAVLAAESARDVRAVSSAGAMGLMQVMPDTWEELRGRYRLGADPFDPRDNILAGTAYLREMLDRYGTVGGMLAAYNAGPARYDEYLADDRPLPAETRAYVAALAPLLGGKPLPDGADRNVSRPIDWRDAPLFVDPLGSGPSARSPQPDSSPDVDSVQDDEATPPSSERMFVARSEPGATQ